MDTSAQNAYLESQVLTATPQKLRLMLIDGAMSAARQALLAWDDGENEQASERLGHCRSIISELLAGVSPDSTPLTQRVAGVYVFLFKLMTEAQMERNVAAVEQALEILAVEQETWRLVCETMPDAPLPADGQSRAPREVTADEAARMLAGENQDPGTYHAGSSGGFTMDA